MTFNIKIATCNANGITNKIDELKTFLTTEKIDIMIIKETKLTTNDKLYFNNYKTYRHDRPTNTGAGGVAVIIKSDIAHRQIKKDHTNSIETITIELTNRVAVTAAYNRPENKFTKTDLKKIFERNRKLIVGGDFNAKHGDWNRGRSNANGNLLKKYTDDNDLTLNYTDEPTHYPENGMSPTTIDLFITKNVTIRRPTTLTALNSDHNPVIITTDGQYRKNRTRTKITYKNTDRRKYTKTKTKSGKRESKN
jgi:endonuclease/exonuclease/phosphatase (EEP) superfamily protein YafD